MSDRLAACPAHLLGSLRLEDPVHSFCSGGQHRPQFAPIDTSVVLELECPASRAISSTGTPELDIRETKEWRNSRGVQFVPIFAALQAALNSRRTLAASRGAPVLVAKTRS